jgi:hypothetical protein
LTGRLLSPPGGRRGHAGPHTKGQPKREGVAIQALATPIELVTGAITAVEAALVTVPVAVARLVS